MCVCVCGTCQLRPKPKGPEGIITILLQELAANMLGKRFSARRQQCRNNINIVTKPTLLTFTTTDNKYCTQMKSKPAYADQSCAVVVALQLLAVRLRIHD